MPFLVLFAVGFVLRALFVVTGPDGGASWHLAMQGDAPVWQDLAGKLARGMPDEEFQLPWRPPGMLWFTSALWNGDPAAVGLVRWTCVVLGALVAPLFWLWLVRARVDRTTAFVAGAITAMATNLMLLATGLHVEGVYLTFVLGTLLLQQTMTAVATRTALLAAVVLGASHGALCLLRAEHVLTFFVLLPLARRAGAARSTVLAALVAAVAVVAPWQLHANAQVDAYNRQPVTLPQPSLPWEADAMTALHEQPTFAQMPTLGFVTETVRVRGGERVTRADLQIVREAYDCVPQALPHAFVASYGALNFFLANSPEADGGFSRAALDREPPLHGGEAKYPPGLRRVLPRGGQLKFGYPPHLDAVVNGTQKGFADLLADPWGGLVRIAKKAWHALEGATGGIGGHALPIGLSGMRRQVDMVTADGLVAQAWRGLVLGVAAFGLWRLRSRTLLPWFAFAATKLVVVLAYFGYARHGAVCSPLLALGVAEVLTPWLRGRVRLGASALVAVLLLDGVRACLGATATVDGQPATNGEPFGANDFAAHRLEFH